MQEQEQEVEPKIEEEELMPCAHVCNRNDEGSLALLKVLK
jgi:hypothetical protein